MIRIKRAYEAPDPTDGKRVLVDALWPRRVRWQDARLDAWVRALAPSAELNRWFRHEPARFAEFRRRYRLELRTHPKELDQLLTVARRGRLTLVYAARGGPRTNAAVLQELLEELR